MGVEEVIENLLEIGDILNPIPDDWVGALNEAVRLLRLQVREEVCKND